MCYERTSNCEKDAVSATADQSSVPPDFSFTGFATEHRQPYISATFVIPVIIWFSGLAVALVYMSLNGGQVGAILPFLLNLFTPEIVIFLLIFCGTITAILGWGAVAKARARRRLSRAHADA